MLFDLQSKYSCFVSGYFAIIGVTVGIIELLYSVGIVAALGSSEGACVGVSELILSLGSTVGVTAESGDSSGTIGVCVACGVVVSIESTSGSSVDDGAFVDFEEGFFVGFVVGLFVGVRGALDFCGAVVTGLSVVKNSDWMRLFLH